MRERIWDEGYEVGYDDAIFDQRGLFTDSDAHQYPHENPYRGLESADIDVVALRARAIDQAAQVAKQSTVAVDVTGVWLGSRYHPVTDPAVVLALLDRLAVAEAVVKRVQAVAEAGDIRTLDDSEEPCVMLDDLRAAIDNEEQP